MRTLLAMALAAWSGAAQAQGDRGPVIDMHLHASRVPAGARVTVCPGSQELIFPALDPRDPPDPANLTSCAAPLYPPATAAELMRQSLAMLDKYNIRRAVTSGPPAALEAWHTAAPDRIIRALNFTAQPPPRPAELRRLHRERAFAVFAEISTQYQGLEAGDPRYAPYWALAEELDVPVGIHLGEGLPAAARSPGNRYRARLTTPFQLEEVLFRHPRLRVYVMHYASPLVDEMIAMLFTHSNLYVDVAANNWNMPRAHFHSQLKRLIDAGFEKRIMFGSDQTIFPEGIGEAILGIDSAPFLSERQKRDIFYNNAARFLRLTPAEIASDHRR